MGALSALSRCREPRRARAGAHAGSLGPGGAEKRGRRQAGRSQPVNSVGAGQPCRQWARLSVTGSETHSLLRSWPVAGSNAGAGARQRPTKLPSSLMTPARLVSPVGSGSRTTTGVLQGPFGFFEKACTSPYSRHNSWAPVQVDCRAQPDAQAGDLGSFGAVQLT